MAHFREGEGQSGSAMPQVGATVFDAQGQCARVVSIRQSGAQAHALVRLDQERELLLPLSLLSLQPDGVYRLPFGFDGLRFDAGRRRIVIEARQEELQVGKRTVDTGTGVRVHKTVSEHEQVVDLPLMCDELLIEHIPIGQLVSTAALPAPRYEGDTLIVPVLEEVLVVEKRLRLKEEVRITKRQRAKQAPQTVVLREEQVAIERFDEGADAASRDHVPDSPG